MDADHPNIVSGLWYLGNPCKRGHQGLRRSDNDGCIDCNRERSINYYYANIERLKVQQKAYESQPEIRARKTEQMRARRKSDPVRQKQEKKRQYQKDLEKSRKQGRLNSQARRSRTRKVKLETILKEDIDRLFAEFGNTCAYCGSSQKLTLDHIYPISRGGDHALSNLVPACVRCNSSKNDLHPLAWYENQDFFSIEQIAFIAVTKGIERWIRMYKLNGD